MDLFPGPDETADTFFDGRIKILQKKRGYRFSVDAVLLSRFVRIRRQETAIDLGTGCAILPLLLSGAAGSIVGVEIQGRLAELALRNVLLNGLHERISILHQDFRKLRDTFPAGTFDVVLSNPPYRRPLTGRVNPSLEKAVARHEIQCTLEDLISVASYLLRPKGRCYFIYPASRAVDLITTLRQMGLEPKRMQWVHPSERAEAKFVLVEGVKSSGVELRVLMPLVLDAAPVEDGEKF
jgi:tRNA1Val (adenine37-N6)-methyltransferase